MKSIQSVYKIGHGPSSSHTVGPYRAACLMAERFPGADHVRVTLYGSLAATGEGHSTGKAIHGALPGCEVILNSDVTDLPHPNTMLFEMYKDGALLCRQYIYSIGGGSIRLEGEDNGEEAELYPEKSFTEIVDQCKKEGISLRDFIYRREGDTLRPYLTNIWHAMENSVRSGLKRTGELPGGLHITRKARLLNEKRCYNESADVTMNRVIASYAFAVSEENASEELVVTAPTCGSCGVIPAVFYYMRHDRGFPEEEIVDSLAVAGLLGNLIRTNASISGAECGCQAEIGSACSMAAGGLSSLYRLSVDQTEYAAEIAMEHHLGLTCDPVCGLVQIPCIERNAVAAMRAINAVDLSRFLTETRKISFDDIVTTMYQTGRDLDVRYRETAHGGLAALYSLRNGLQDNN